MTKLERILLDDDRFFGVNERSHEQSRQQRIEFENNKAIIQVIDDAYALGIRAMMCTTHDRMGDICAHVKATPAKYRGFAFYPMMPQGHKYAASVAEVGILETIKRFSTGGVVSTLFRASIGAITQDIFDLMKLLVDAEMKRFDGIDTPVVFLQNVVTDLVLGMKMYDLFGEFHRYMYERYKAEAGFVTMNLPALVDALETVGVRNPVVCATINKTGFRMSGGLEAYERTLRDRKVRVIARGVLPSSDVTPEDGFGYVCGHKKIEGIVVNATSRADIAAVQALIQKLDGS